MKLLKNIGSLLATTTGGKDSGLISLLKDKTGKISFKRSFPILVTTYVFTIHVPANGGILDLIGLGALAVGMLAYVLPKLIGQDSE